jgi:hypothetical protein
MFPLEFLLKFYILIKIFWYLFFICVCVCVCVCVCEHIALGYISIVWYTYESLYLLYCKEALYTYIPASPVHIHSGKPCTHTFRQALYTYIPASPVLILSGKLCTHTFRQALYTYIPALCRRLLNLRFTFKLNFEAQLLFKIQNT